MLNGVRWVLSIGWRASSLDFVWSGGHRPRTDLCFCAVALNTLIFCSMLRAQRYRGRGCGVVSSFGAGVRGDMSESALADNFSLRVTVACLRLFFGSVDGDGVGIVACKARHCNAINKWSKRKLGNMTDETSWVVLTRSRSMRPAVSILD